MSEMVERVARAICGSFLNCQRHKIGRDDACVEEDGRSAPCRASRDELILGLHWGAAKAAIAAMREPSKEMLTGARDWSAKKYGKPVGDDDASGCWRAMIDGGLK